MPIDDRVLNTLVGVGGRIRVFSALNPGLWLSGLTVAGFTVVSAARAEVPWPLTAAMLASVGATTGLLVYFAVFDPDRLQSEDFQLKKQSLALVAEKGTKQQRADAAEQVLMGGKFRGGEEG